MSDSELDGSLGNVQQRLSGERQDNVDQLQLYQIELEMQNRELSASQSVLEESRAHYAELYDYAPVGYATVDHAGAILDINLTAASLFGRERRRLIGQPMSLSLAEGSGQVLLSFLRTIPQRGAGDGPAQLEVQTRDSGYGARDLRIVGVARTPPGSEAPEHRLAIYDVSEEKLQQENRRLHSLIMANMREGVLLIRQDDGVIIETNPACEQMYGYAPGKLAGLPVTALDTCSVRSEEAALSRLLVSAKPPTEWEKEYRRRDGSCFWCEASAFQFLHASYGRVWLVVQRDVTTRRQAEQQAREHEAELARVMRINTVGELAASLAHELTQPLMAVEHLNHAAMGLLQQSPIPVAGVEELLQTTERQLQRARNIIFHMRKFIRQGTLETRCVPVEELIDASLALTHSLLRDNATSIGRRDATSPLQVEVAPVQVEQVLVNLISNSVQAMAKAKSPRRHIDIGVEVLDEMVRVSLHDSGPGLAPGRSEHLFNVLQTDKEDGVGMGLAISRSLIQGHGGRLWAEEPESGGACFCFTLPLVADQGEGGDE